MYRIEIDRALCSGFGACVELAPDVIALDPDGLASVRVGSTTDRAVLRRRRRARWPQSPFTRRRQPDGAIFGARRRSRSRWCAVCGDVARRGLRRRPRARRRRAPRAIRAARALEGVPGRNAGGTRASAARTLVVGSTQDRPPARSPGRPRRHAQPERDDCGPGRNRLGRPRPRDRRPAAAAAVSCAEGRPHPANGRRREDASRGSRPRGSPSGSGRRLRGSRGRVDRCCPRRPRATILEALATPFDRSARPSSGSAARRSLPSHVRPQVHTGATAPAPPRTVPYVRCCSPMEARSAAMSRSWVSASTRGELLPVRAPGLHCLRVRQRHRRPRSLDERRRRGRCRSQQILGLSPRTEQPAFFWSNRSAYGSSSVGHPAATAVVELEGGEEDFLARYQDDDGRLVAALGANRPAEVASLRRELAVAA